MDFQIQEFDLLKTVGKGTFGSVCLSLHKPSETYYAMKILSLREIIKLEQVEHVKNERNILGEIDHPFLLSLTWSCIDKNYLYLIFPYISGGELFSYLRCYGKFSLQTTLFYITEILTAITYLHSLNIIYRDLKPENILLEKDGHIVITDLGFSRKALDGERCLTQCGTPDYMAPEIILEQGHHKCVDWWALGVLTFELLTGLPPFTRGRFSLYKTILLGKVNWPRYINLIAKDFIEKLLVSECEGRLGHGESGSQDVKNHKLFLLVDWEDVENRKCPAPIIPKITHDGDTRNFEHYPEPSWSKDILSEEELRLFDQF